MVGRPNVCVCPIYALFCGVVYFLILSVIEQRPMTKQVTSLIGKR